jgi:predicted Rossmann fold nucleotide-binding protein DprA/Smf involved in DNA uptake
MSNEMIQTALDLGVEIVTPEFVPTPEEVAEMKVNEVISTGPSVRVETEVVEETAPAKREYGTAKFRNTTVHTIGDQGILTELPFVAVAISRNSSKSAIAASEAAAHSLAAEGTHNLLVCGLIGEDMPMVRAHIAAGGCVLVVCSLGLDGIELTDEILDYINTRDICVISQFHDSAEWIIDNGQRRNELVARAECVSKLLVVEARGQKQAMDIAKRFKANSKKVYIPAINQSSPKEMSQLKKVADAIELEAQATEIDQEITDVYAVLSK